MKKTHSSILKKTICKYQLMSLPAKAGLWFTISAFLQRGITFLATPVFTRILSTEQYGIVSVFNTWEQLIAVLCTLNLFYGGFNNGMRDYKQQRDKYVSAIQGLITAITVFWLGVYFIAMPYWNKLLDMKTHIVLLMFFQILMTSALSLWAARERFEFRYKALLVVTLCNTLLGTLIPIVAILLISKAENGAEIRIVSHALTVICICGCIYIYNLYKGRRLYSKDIWKTAFLFNLPLLPHYLSTMILNHSDRIMIRKMVGASEAGIYSVAYSAAMILNILTTSINHSFAPWIYGELDNERYDRIAEVGNSMFFGVAIVLMMLIAFAPECIYIIAGPKYAEAVGIIPAVASSLYFVFMYQIFANIEFYYKKNRFIAYASITGAILNVILNYFGIRAFGFYAPGYTTLICYMVFGVSHYLFMSFVCKDKLPEVRLFDSGSIFSVALGLVVFAIIMVFLYSYTQIRYIILLLIIFFVIINRKRVGKYFSIIQNDKEKWEK